MGRWSEAPVGNTCPMIDEVISAIKSAKWDEDCFWDEDRVIEIMEQIRSANGTLRDWGYGLCKLRDEKDEEIKELECKIGNLEYDLNSVAEEKEKLEREIEQLS